MVNDAQSTYVRIVILPQSDCAENYCSEIIMKPSALRQARLTPKLHLWSLSPASVSFGNLASEIWHEVCAYLDRKSLAAVRRVCQRLADIAAHNLFQDLYVNWLPNSIDRLSMIASHPKLSRHVQSLAFEQRLLRQDLTNFDDWKSCVDISPLIDREMSVDGQRDQDGNEIHPEVDPWDGPFEDQAQRRMHALLLRVLRGQATIIADAGRLGIEASVNPAQDRDLACIHDMVSKLVEGQPFLRCMHTVLLKLVEDQQALLADPGAPGLLGHLMFSLPNLHTLRMTPLTFGEWTDYDCCEPDFEAFERWNVARESLQAGFLLSDAFEYGEVLPHKALQPIQLVLDALAVAPTPVKKLQVCAIPAHFWMGGDEAGIHESNLMRQKEKKFLSLQSLDIRLIMSRRNNGLARFPQHCANVTYLNLRLYAGSSTNPEAGSFCVRSLWDGYPLGDISEILKQLRLSHLQTLVVDRFSIAESAFVTFLKSHTETLRSITFKIPYMIEPVQQATGVSSWENAIRELAPLMSLKHADLGELQDSALSILFRKDSDQDGFYCPDIRDGKIRRFSASVAAYLLSGGQAHYPKYEPLERKSVSCASEGGRANAAAA